MTDKPAVLIVAKRLAPLATVLANHYTVYCLWESPPVEAERDVRAIVTDGDALLDSHILDRLPNLGLVACFTVGYEGIDLDYVRRRGLQVSYAAGTNADDVADHAMGFILADRRQIVSGDRRVRSGAWSRSERGITRSLRGETVGIVGLGRIGEAVAIRSEAFGMEVRWWGPSAKPDARWPRAESLVQLAQQSDILVLCAKLDERSRGSIGGEVLDALGPRGLLVNVARGALVDEAALRERLTSGALGGAALDVFETEPTPPQIWTNLPNVLLTPHTAGATDRSVQGMMALLLENLELFFAGKPLKTPLED